MEAFIRGAVILVDDRVAYAKASGLTPRTGATYRVPAAPWRKVWHTVEAPEDDPDTAPDEGWELDQLREHAVRHRTPPHLWAAPEHDWVGQTVPLNLSAYALRHESGDPETNHAHAIQTEVIGYAKDGPLRGDVADWLGERVLGPILAAGAPIAPFIVAPSTGSDGSGENGKVRMSWDQWASFGGQCGHANVPGNCVTADTPILCADLQWRPAGDLLVGDELIAFDETSPNQAGRRLRRATVIHADLRRDALLRINTQRGSVRCNYEHPWLVRRGRRGGRPVYGEWGRWEWMPARDLVAGDEVCFALDPWQTERSWDAGWLAGMYDGEGSLCTNRRGVFLSCVQRVSPTADEMVRQIKERVPVSPIKRFAAPKSGTDMVQATIMKRADALRMLGMVRPARLLAKADAAWDGASLGKLSERVTIESIEGWGTGTIAALSTSTETYIAAGFAMHNSHWDPGVADYLRIARAINQEDNMPLTNDDLKNIASAVWGYRIGDDVGMAKSTLRDARQISRRHEVDAAAQLAALREAIGQLGGGGSVDYARVEEAAEAAVRRVFADAATAG